MNNSSDNALYFLSLGDACPTLEHVKAALAAAADAHASAPPLPAGCVLANIPGAPGLVRLTGVPAASAYAPLAHAIEEVGLSFPEGSAERNFVMANIANANAMENIEGLTFTAVCYPLLPDGTLDNAHGGFWNTRADASHRRGGADKWRTVAEATAYWANAAQPSGGGGHFGGV